jgi:hypothetical protein
MSLKRVPHLCVLMEMNEFEESASPPGDGGDERVWLEERR